MNDISPIVFVVDDDPDIVELLRCNFASNGYQVFTATIGTQPPNLSRQQLPDLILIDLTLPGIRRRRLRSPGQHPGRHFQCAPRVDNREMRPKFGRSVNVV